MSIEKSNKLIKKNTGNNISVSIKNHFLDFKLIKYMLKAFTALFWFDAIVRYIIWRLGDSMHDDKFSITLFIPFYRLYICLCFSGEFEKARLLSSLTHAYTHFIAPFHFQLGVNGCARVFVRVCGEYYLGDETAHTLLQYIARCILLTKAFRFKNNTGSCYTSAVSMYWSLEWSPW